MPSLLIATRNPGKLRELRELLSSLPYTLLGLKEAGIAEEAPEEGHTLEENAQAKALFYYRLSGLLTLSEDSGLEVEALRGEPGPLSRRYAGEGASDGERIAYLLRRLVGVPASRCTACFHSVIAIAGAGEGVKLFQGECSGLIAPEPRGSGGFGYDPVFLVPELGLTFAQLSSPEKNRLSHRGRASLKAARFLLGLLAETKA